MTSPLSKDEIDRRVDTINQIIDHLIETQSVGGGDDAEWHVIGAILRQAMLRFYEGGDCLPASLRAVVNFAFEVHLEHMQNVLDKNGDSNEDK